MAQSYSPNAWDSVNATTVPGRYLGASFTIGTIIYYGTGTTSAGYYSNDFWAYNTIANTWTSLAPFPGAARSDAIGFSLNGKGYLGLGDDGTTAYYDLYRYDPTTNTWSTTGTIATLPSLAGATNNDVAFTIDGYGYVGLGSTTSGAASSYLYRYDPVTNTWSSMASFTGTPRGAASAFVVDNIAYVGMGANFGGPLNDFYSYNPSTNAWASIASFPGAAADAAAAFSICGYGYVGIANSNNFYQYDPLANTWSAMNSYPGSTVSGTLSASISITGDTAFGFVGFGSETGAAGPFPSSFYKYYPPVQCIPTSVSTLEANPELTVSPNPATDIINIKSASEISYQLCDMLGRTICSSIVANKEFEINVAGLNSGVYFLKINYGNGQNEVRKIEKI